MAFTCCMCKENFDDSPVFKNGAGEFCEECRHEMIRRIKESNASRASDGRCIWCGDPLEGAVVDDNVHIECTKNRDWLLKCIRHSGRVLKYVQRVDRREKELRQARIRREKAESESAANQISGDKAKKNGTDERLDRVEAMLTKLLSALE